MLKRCFKQNTLLLFIYGSFVVFGTALLFLYGKADIHLTINRYHTSFFDIFFKHLTKIAEGLAITGIIIIVAWRFSYRKAAYILSVNLLSAVTTQLLKRLMFDDVVRPKAFFKDIAELYFVKGIEIHEHFSFPSGHTTAAFATFFSLALISKHQLLKIIFLFIALLIGYSRMYLSQHFISDVLAGSIIGTTFALFLYYLTFCKNVMFKSQKINRSGIKG